MPVRSGNVPESTPALDQPMPLSRLWTTTATPKPPVRTPVASSRARRDIMKGSSRAADPTLAVVPALCALRTGAGTHNPREKFDEDWMLNVPRYDDGRPS